MSSESTALRRLVAVILGATLALAALGGAVRATDSGLACPDWPACYGMWVPPPAVNIWLEHSHRLLAGAVGLMIAALLILVLARHRRRRGVLIATVAVAVLVNVQAALGALVVLRLLQAELVTAHLGMSLVVLGLLTFLVRWSSRPADRGGSRGQGGRDDRAIAWAFAAVAGLTFVQTLVGGHTSGLNAGLAWQTWPLYDGVVFPAIPDVPHLVHVAHRTLGIAVLGGVGCVAVVVRRHRARQRAVGGWTPAHAWLVRGADAAVGLTLVQVALGVANLWTLTSPATVIPHLAVATWIWTVLVATALHAAWLAPSRDTEPVGPSPAPRTEGATA